MSEQQPEVPAPDDVADEKARREAEERQSVADGAGAPSPDEDGDLQDEAAYSTEGEQGAAQPSPG